MADRNLKMIKITGNLAPLTGTVGAICPARGDRFVRFRCFLDFATHTPMRFEFVNGRFLGYAFGDRLGSTASGLRVCVWSRHFFPARGTARWRTAAVSRDENTRIFSAPKHICDYTPFAFGSIEISKVLKPTSSGIKPFTSMVLIYKLYLQNENRTQHLRNPFMIH